MIVLDTNVVSEMMRDRPDPRVVDWLNDQLVETLYLPAVTVAEVAFVVACLPDGRRRGALAARFERIVSLFPGRLLPLDERAGRAYGRIAAAARAIGRPLPVADGLIAATAVAAGFAVATRNVGDFDAAGVAVLDPWSAE